MKVVIVDAHKLFRVSLKSLVSSFSNLEVVLDIAAISEIPKEFNVKDVRLVIVDPNTVKNNFDAIQSVFAYSKILILTDSTNAKNLGEYIKKGAAGLYSKKDCPSNLRKTILELTTQFHQSEVVFGPVMKQLMIEDIGNRNKKHVNFSNREMQILQFVCLEKTNSEISELLGLSIRTIESHRRRMIEKADCRSIIGVIINALELNNISLTGITGTSNQAS